MNKSEELNALRSSLLQNDSSWNAGSNLIFELSEEDQNKRLGYTELLEIEYGIIINLA